METITLVDGTVLNGTVLPNGDGVIIFVYLTGMNLAEGFLIFSNTENIATLTVMNHGTEYIYEGYTEISAINTEYGNCNIIMKKPAVIPEPVVQETSGGEEDGNNESEPD